MGVGKVIVIYEVTPETIIIKYGMQYFCINGFGMRNSKWIIKRTHDEIECTKQMDISEMIRIVRRNNLVLSSAHRGKDD